MTRTIQPAGRLWAWVHPAPLRRWLSWMLLMGAMLSLSHPVMADPPIWANAKRVKATLTTCGEQRSVLFKADSARAMSSPTPAGCRTVEVFYTQLNVFKSYFRSQDGAFAQANVDAGYLTCGGDDPAGGQRGVLILGSQGAIARAIREHPAPRGCAYLKERFQHVSSAGRIPFADVPNGGTMTVRESLELHARERERAIAECNASPACRAEVRRRSAINAYFDCMKPLQPNEAPRTCYRPW